MLSIQRAVFVEQAVDLPDIRLVEGNRLFKRDGNCGAGSFADTGANGHDPYCAVRFVGGGYGPSGDDQVVCSCRY